MIAQYWNTVRRWCEDTVRSSAIKGLSESVHGKIVKKILAPILAYIVVAAVLTGQLALQQWPESFAAFLLGSPAIACSILSILAIACRPSIASKVPLYALGGFALLASLQCIMGAFAMCLPSPPSRMVFALVSSIVVLCLCFGLSKSFVNSSLRTLRKAKARAEDLTDAVVQRADDDGDETDDDSSQAYADAKDV